MLSAYLKRCMDAADIRMLRDVLDQAVQGQSYRDASEKGQYSASLFYVLWFGNGSMIMSAGVDA